MPLAGLKSNSKYSCEVKERSHNRWELSDKPLVKVSQASESL